MLIARLNFWINFVYNNNYICKMNDSKFSISPIFNEHIIQGEINIL